jgi:hypothetical protein
MDLPPTRRLLSQGRLMDSAHTAAGSETGAGLFLRSLSVALLWSAG